VRERWQLLKTGIGGSEGALAADQVEDGRAIAPHPWRAQAEHRQDSVHSGRSETPAAPGEEEDPDGREERRK
jgi:hypothetical protein